jgi:hypothetical protein
MEYFRLLRALQAVDESRVGEVADVAAFDRLVEVTSSPVFGKKGDHGLLPRSIDPLHEALDSLDDWTVGAVVACVHDIAAASADCSLVGLAAQTRDPIIIAALRESVALYSATLSLDEMPPLLRYHWRVDPALEARATRFVRIFNDLFDEELPAPIAENAEEFHLGRVESRIHGRCVCIALDPPRYYHWAIDKRADGSYFVEDFWADALWTTRRYRTELVDRAMRAGHRNIGDMFEFSVGSDAWLKGYR